MSIWRVGVDGPPLPVPLLPPGEERDLEFGRFRRRNPKGIAPQSPGLRGAAPERSDGGGTSYPGNPSAQGPTPTGLRLDPEHIFRAIRPVVCAEMSGRNPVGVVRLFGQLPRGNWNKLLVGRSAWARASQPWALGWNPVGIRSWMHGRTGFVPPPLSKNVQTSASERMPNCSWKSDGAAVMQGELERFQRSHEAITATG